MRHRFIVMVTSLAVAAAAACGSSQSASKNSRESEDSEICEPAAVTGTNITRTVCRTRAEADAERRAAREWRTQPVNPKR